MNDNGFEERLSEISKIREDYPDSYFLVLMSVIVIIMIVLGFLGSESFFQNLYPNLISVVITVGIIEVLQRKREKKKELALKITLNWNYIKNPNAPETHSKFFEMVVYDALSGYVTTNFDISKFKGEGLKITKAYFRECIMQKTEWNRVNFSRSTFYFVNLEGAIFNNCSLDNCRIDSSELGRTHFANVSARKLQGSFNMNGNLTNVDLRDANLAGSSFEGSVFSNVNLQQTNLKNVNLKGAVFYDSLFNALTILPDGKFYDISKGLNQLKRYIDPNQSDFFSVENPSYAVPQSNKTES